MKIKNWEKLTEKKAEYKGFPAFSSEDILAMWYKKGTEKYEDYGDDEKEVYDAVIVLVERGGYGYVAEVTTLKQIGLFEINADKILYNGTNCEEAKKEAINYMKNNP